MNDDLLQDPAATLDHSIDWTTWLAGDAIASPTTNNSTWSVTPQTNGQPAITNPAVNGNVASCYLSGVTFGQIYQLTNKVVTVAGRTDQRSLTIRGYAE